MTPDRIDDALLPVFLEEGRDLMTVIGDGFAKLRTSTSPLSLLAHLRGPIHTIKGSARMMGAMQFGAHWHAVEGVIATLLTQATVSEEEITMLLGQYDLGVQMFTALAHPQHTSDHGTDPLVTPAAGKITSGDKKSRRVVKAVSHVRIRANLLDQFLNQAGEIAIAGTHVDNGMTQLHALAQELGSTIARVEKHVRQAGTEAEIHIQSLHQQTDNETGFDALELDRFTLRQELARLMTDNLADLMAVHKTLGKVLGDVREFSARHARLTRNLQQDIMAARMLPFGSLNDRLQRLMKQASREADKEVVLTLQGGEQMMDRSVLEKMAVVLEHLLRNAIAHGIEHRLTRLNAVKPAHGNLHIAMSTEGNALSICVSDDGQGLDLQRIRARAEHAGLLSADQEITADNLFDLIAHPGLSTSEHVTPLSGRGVGLDVVRTEVTALGGRIDVETQGGLGTVWRIYLPLTFAVTPVVLVRLGDVTYAIPSLTVRQVIRGGDGVHHAMVDHGMYDWEGAAIPVVSLARLLQVRQDKGTGQTGLVLENGKQRMVVLVDAVLGNQEVVTKHIGVQLARVRGLLGATILGTGDIVLIVHPGLLMQRKDVPAVVPHVQCDDTVLQRKCVMVVDDSLTVRHVLQKLLVREGYAVIVAKDGMDAMLQLQKTIPDMLLVDIDMPRMDGFHLLEKLRARPDTATLPVVMITSRTAKKHEDKARSLGANAYLGKPYQETVLLDLIAGYIGRDQA